MADTGLVTLVVANSTQHPAALYWCDGDKRDVQYGESLQPGQSREQQTFVNHTWRLRSCSRSTAGPSTAELLEVEITTGAEPEQSLMLLPADGSALAGTGDATKTVAVAAKDFYTQECDVGIAGLRVRASAEVNSTALFHAADLIRHMLQHSSPSVLQRLQARQCSVSVFGRKQKTSDIPEHREWALTAQRPDEKEKVLNEAASEAEPDSAVDAAAVERWERADALASRLAPLPQSVLCAMICGLVRQGIVSDVAFLSALPPAQEVGNAAAVMTSTECPATCDQATAPPSPPPPPQSTSKDGPNGHLPPSLTTTSNTSLASLDGMRRSSDAKRGAGKRALELSAGEVSFGGAGGALRVSDGVGRRAVEAAAKDMSIDATTRGVGGGRVVSVGEENLVDELDSDPHYPDESILVHEFGELQPLLRSLPSLSVSHIRSPSFTLSHSPAVSLFCLLLKCSEQLPDSRHPASSLPRATRPFTFAPDFTPSGTLVLQLTGCQIRAPGFMPLCSTIENLTHTSKHPKDSNHTPSTSPTYPQPLHPTLPLSQATRCST
jgi:hypothetical protein